MKLDVTLETAHYLAQFDSSDGAVCYRLCHKASRSELLRTPYLPSLGQTEAPCGCLTKREI